MFVSLLFHKTIECMVMYIKYMSNSKLQHAAVSYRYSEHDGLKGTKNGGSDY